MGEGKLVEVLLQLPHLAAGYPILRQGGDLQLVIGPFDVGFPGFSAHHRGESGKFKDVSVTILFPCDLELLRGMQQKNLVLDPSKTHKSCFKTNWRIPRKIWLKITCCLTIPYVKRPHYEKNFKINPQRLLPNKLTDTPQAQNMNKNNLLLVSRRDKIKKRTLGNQCKYEDQQDPCLQMKQNLIENDIPSFLNEQYYPIIVDTVRYIIFRNTNKVFRIRIKNSIRMSKRIGILRSKGKKQKNI